MISEGVEAANCLHNQQNLIRHATSLEFFYEFNHFHLTSWILNHPPTIFIFRIILAVTLEVEVSERHFLLKHLVLISSEPLSLGWLSGFRSSHWRCPVKKMFLKILQYSQENTSARVSSFVGIRPATLLKKRLWYRRFPVNFAKF